MTNKDEHIFQLLLEKLSGEISDENRLYLEQEMQKDASIRRCLEEMEDALKAAGPDFMTDVYNEIAWSRVLSLMTAEETVPGGPVPPPIAEEPVPVPLSSSPARKNAYKWWMAAAMISIISTGLYFLLAGRLSHKEEYATGNISFSSLNGVHLLMEDGDTVHLNGNGGTEINTRVARLFTRRGQLSFTAHNGASGWNVLSIPTGKAYSIALADGSTVHMNAHSRLRFPFSFAGDTREVYLEGEAFFDIAPDADHPFIVHTSGTSVKVLGTTFNVNAYSDSLVITSLVAGSVVTKADSQQEVLLQPGNETVYRAGKPQQVRAFDKGTTLSWLNGEYVYYDQPLSDLEGVLQHWFGKTLIFDDPGLSAKRLTGVIERDKPFMEFLESLNRTSGILYSIDNDNIHLRLK